MPKGQASQSAMGQALAGSSQSTHTVARILPTTKQQ